MEILVINGPNLNLLGEREPEVYGSTTLADIEGRLKNLASEWGAGIGFFQSNHEGALIDAIQGARGRADAIIINPGGYTHTSVAMRDALSAVMIPFIEVHLSNVHKREDFRRKSLFSDIAAGTITGLGPAGYELALYAIAKNPGFKR